jgi:hypothetical protein
MNWRKRRQALYISVTLIIVAAILGYLVYDFLSTPGTCYDGARNQGERGADCGGPCARVCAFEARDPVVEWARALPTGQNSYTGVAYVRNPQASLGAAAYNVTYTIRLLGADNHLIIEHTGKTDLPAVGTIPIIAPNIPTGSQNVARAQFSFLSTKDKPIVWTTIPEDDRPTIWVKNQILAPDATRLSATIVNDTNWPVYNLSVMAVLFDASGNAVVASRSVIQEISPEAQNEVVFTWPQPTSGVVRAEITPLPALPRNPQP